VKKYDSDIVYEGVFLLLDKSIFFFKKRYNVVTQLKNALLYHSFVYGKFYLLQKEPSGFNFKIIIGASENCLLTKEAIVVILQEEFERKIII
jgi:hypothetical protein